MNQGSGLGLFVFLLVTVGLVAGVLGLGGDNWSRRNYVPVAGDCFVPPQGDPLYDAHYAQEVNSYNCDAFKVQSESKFIDAQTKGLEASVVQTKMGTSIIVFIFGASVILLGLLMVKR